ncbi:MAG: hypothetical protein AAF193_03280, partial [Bacteroidota bacterium]
MENPEYEDYVEIKKAEEREAYEELYRKYSYRQYVDVITGTTEIINSQPDNHLLCKHKLLKALSTGYMDALTGSSTAYVTTLQEVIDGCPGSEEATAAQEYLRAVNGEASVPEEVAPEEPEAPEESIYEESANERHYFAIIFEVSKADVNEVKALASDFNTSYFKSSALRVSSNLLDRERQIVLVKTFNKLESAEDYYRTFTNNSQELKEINE